MSGVQGGAAGARGIRPPPTLPTRRLASPRRLLPRAAVSRHVRGDAWRPTEPPTPGPGPQRWVPASRPRPPWRGIKLSLQHSPCARVCGVSGGHLLAGTVARPARGTVSARRQSRPGPRQPDTPPADSPAPTPPVPRIGQAAARAGPAARTSGPWRVPGRTAPSAASPASLAPASAPARPPRRHFGAWRQLTARSRAAGSRESRRRYEHPQCEGEGTGREAVRAAWVRAQWPRAHALQGSGGSRASCLAWGGEGHRARGTGPS